MKGERENAFDHPFPKGSMYGPCAFDSRSEKYTLHYCPQKILDFCI
jgi:hypothetical protein